MPLTSLFLYLVFKEPTPSRFRRRIPILTTFPPGCQALARGGSQYNRRPLAPIPAWRRLPAVRQGTCPPTRGRSGFPDGNRQGSGSLPASRPFVNPPAHLPGLSTLRGRETKAPDRSGAFQRLLSGNDLLSHTLAHAVPSALRGLTAVFGMGTGVTPSPESPEKAN